MGRPLTVCWMMLSLGAAWGGTGQLEGVVSDAATGAPLKRVLVRAFAEGRSEERSALSESDGSFVLRDLPPVRHAACASAGDGYRLSIVAWIDVAEGRVSGVRLQRKRSLVIDGDSWLQSQPSFGQSFQATGLALTGARLKGFGPKRVVRAQLVEGEGPKGRLVGPSRATRPFGGEEFASVMWSGGEAATVPGRRYTLVMAAPDGQTWTPGVAGRGDVYPLGSAWFDGSARPHSDIGVVLWEDNDDLRTNYALSGGGRMHRARAAGQTFTALSSTITFASAELTGVGDSPDYVRFSIHEDGPGGAQIGPSKAVAPGPDAAVAWGPDEAPVTPGAEYYLHLESISGGLFLIGYQTDSYASGRAVLNGRPEPDRDLAAMVAGQLSDEDFLRLNAHRRLRERVPLANPSFEEGIAGWERTVDAGAAVGPDGDVVPAWGGRMVGWTLRGKGEGTRAVVFQRVGAEPGQLYSFSGSVLTDHSGGRSSDVKIRLVALPRGGDDVGNNQRIETSQWYATEGQWRRGSVEFRAAAETVTVGFDLEQRFSLPSSSLYVDGALLERIGEE